MLISFIIAVLLSFVITVLLSKKFIPFLISKKMNQPIYDFKFAIKLFSVS